MTRTGPDSSSTPDPRPGWPPSPPDRPRPAAATRPPALVSLPLPRTRTMTVTGHPLTFGSRAASITGEADAGALTALANLDLLQARRHAAVLTGCMLVGELADLQVAAEVTLRGLAAVQAEWSSRHTSARGKAGMFDCPADLPGHPSLEEACRHA